MNSLPPERSPRIPHRATGDDRVTRQAPIQRDQKGGTIAVPRQPPPFCDTGHAIAAHRQGSSHATRGAIRLRGTPTVGIGEHRSGWPYALAALQPIVSPDGILLDDFVEQTFSYRARPVAHTEPWIGIFHHPPNMPSISLPRHRPQEMFTFRSWSQSLPTLRLAIALSKYLAEYLRTQLPVPVAVVRHPTDAPLVRFSAAAFLKNRHKRLIQIGWYLRNTRAIDQVPPLAGYTKSRLIGSATWIQQYDQRVAAHWLAKGIRQEYGGVEELPRLNDTEYDFLLSHNVAFAEYFDVSASNLVTECLARHTPLVVNRYPALAEYLGDDYPLFYDDLSEVRDLLCDDSVLRAHQHLLQRDTGFLDGGVFCQSIANAVGRILA